MHHRQHPIFWLIHDVSLPRDREVNKEKIIFALTLAQLVVGSRLPFKLTRHSQNCLVKAFLTAG